jgi:hypothetical protein
MDDVDDSLFFFFLVKLIDFLITPLKSQSTSSVPAAVLEPSVRHSVSGPPRVTDMPSARRGTITERPSMEIILNACVCLRT